MPRPSRPSRLRSRNTLVILAAACAAWLLTLAAAPPPADEPEPPPVPTGIQTEKSAYLDYALRAERWLRQQVVTTEAGQIWRSADEKDDHPITNGNLYYGSSGVILFYLELYQQTGDAAFLRQAEEGAAYLIGAVPEALYFEKGLNALDLFPSLNQPAEGGIPVYTAANGLGHPNQASLYWGVSGIGFTLGEMARVTGEQAYSLAALQVVNLLLRDHHADSSGASWGSTPELQVGDAGVGLFLLYASRELGHPRAEALAVAIGESLIAGASRTSEGLMWPTRGVYGTDYPNFAHGSAGVGYFLAALHQHTGDERFLEAARAAGRYLVGITRDDGLITHHVPDDEGLVYYGWCHGPTGTNRLFEQLRSEASDPRWGRHIEQSNRAVIEAELVSREPAGFWQNVGQCCGSAGIADYFLTQYEKTKKPEYLAFAQSLSEDIVRHASATGEGLRWTHAEHRSSPEYTLSQTGYMQGAAGIGMHFLRMHAMTNDQPISIRLLDDRF